MPTTERRKRLEMEVYRRLESKGIGNGKRTPETYKVYLAIRHIDRAVNGTVFNHARLSKEEYNRIMGYVDLLFPEEGS